ncbi:MAG: HTH domain-containing protein [Lachnospiraceae bacterium]|nr:HTH domain-containing protein [Lachnospiraceae bacterium]
MDTAHRRMEIISILSVKGHITSRELAWELGVTIRTIHHDIFALTFDYPIYCY